MKYALILLIVFVTCNCKKCELFPDDELSLTRTNNSSAKLKLDGFYYQKSNSLYYTMYCFYENGILLSLEGGINRNQLLILVDEIKSGNFYNSIKTYKDSWGVYAIEDSKIKFERWYPSSGGGYPAYVREGVILNDTTFQINLVYRDSGGKQVEKDSVNELYHYYLLDVKPDSTNQFIE